MGAPMARNLLKGGHTVTVFARRPEAMAPLIDLGAAGASSPAEVASQSDVTITMVIDTRAVEEVTLGARGIIEGARPGSVVVDHSTIDPDGARRVASALKARGIDMLDAPVSGGAPSPKPARCRSWRAATRPCSSASGRSSSVTERRSSTSVRAAPDRSPRPATRSAPSSTRSALPRRC